MEKPASVLPAPLVNRKSSATVLPNLAEFTLSNPSIMDFLISILYSAAYGGRVLLSFPDKQVVAGAGNLSFYENDAPNVSLLQVVLSKVPSVSDMVSVVVHHEGLAEKCELALKEYLDAIDIMVYPLLVWLTDPHRPGTRLLPDEENPSIKCDCIITLANSPVKEGQFSTIKNSIGRGSMFAFHGSCNGNWHSILRTGIRVMSGTEYQTTGTSYGRGVYFGSHSSISHSYCKNRGIAWPNSKFINNSATKGSPTSSLIIMALVELIDHPTEVKVHPCSTGGATANGDSSNIYVCDNEALFTIRMLMINPSSDLCCIKMLESCQGIVEKSIKILDSSL